MFGEVFQRGQLLNRDIVLSSEQFGLSKLRREFKGLNALTDKVTSSSIIFIHAVHLQHLPPDGFKPLCVI